MAQLVARLVRNEKVGGSNPPSSTTNRHPIAGVGFLCACEWCCGAWLSCCLWCRWCSGRRRPRPPARLGDLTAFGAAPRSPPVPSGPSGALHTGGACGAACGASACCPARHRYRPAMWPATCVKPSTPLLAWVLSPVKPTTPLRARYTWIWCYFIEERRRGFHTGVLRFPHWC